MLYLPFVVSQARPTLNRRQEIRYETDQEARLSWNLQIAGARLQDVSWGGCRVIVEKPVLKPKMRVCCSCTIDGRVVGRQRVAAKVLWVRNTPHGQEAGLAFQEDVQGTWVRELLKRITPAFPDRRRYQRYNVSCALRWQDPVSNNYGDGETVDLSLTGARIRVGRGRPCGWLRVQLGGFWFLARVVRESLTLEGREVHVVFQNAGNRELRILEQVIDKRAA